MYKLYILCLNSAAVRWHLTFLRIRELCIVKSYLILCKQNRDIDFDKAYPMLPHTILPHNMLPHNILPHNMTQRHRNNADVDSVYVIKFMLLFILVFFCVFLAFDFLSVLRGHSFFSSPPLRLMTSAFEGFLYRFYPLHLFSYLISWERASIFPFECSVLNKGTTGTIL